MKQHTQQKTKRTSSVASRNTCRVATNVKAGWKWLDDLKDKVSENLNKVKNV